MTLTEEDARRAGHGPPPAISRRLVAPRWTSLAGRLGTLGALSQPDVASVRTVRALQQAAGEAFYNTSKFTLRDLRNRSSQQRLRADFETYLDGFSTNVQEILDNLEFRNQIPRLSKADALGALIDKLLSADINRCSPPTAP